MKIKYILICLLIQPHLTNPFYNPEFLASPSSLRPQAFANYAKSSSSSQTIEQDLNPPDIVYVSGTTINAETFFMGRGFGILTPEKPLSLWQALDYLEGHPNDIYMLTYAKKLVIRQGVSAVSELIERFNEKPSSSVLEILVSVGETIPKAEDFVKELCVKNKPLFFELISQSPSPYIRCLLRPELRIMHQGFDTIFNRTRNAHFPISEMEIRRVPVPQELVDKAKARRYVHISAIKRPGVIARPDINTGTSLREVDIDQALRDFNMLATPRELIRPPVQGMVFRETYSVAISWERELRARNGRHNYVVKFRGANSGKGLSRKTAEVSAKREFAERLSATAGATDNFPSGYVSDLTFTKASYSQLIAKGFNALDPNTLNLIVPYQDQELYWVRGIRKTEKTIEEVFVPSQLVFIEDIFDEPCLCVGSSNGLASGNTMEEAKLHALLEIIERDGDYTVFYSPKKCFTIDTENEKDESIKKILDSYKKLGLEVAFLDMTTEFGVPTYRAFLKIGDQVISGSGSHLDGKIAMMRAICELSPKARAFLEATHGPVIINKEAYQKRRYSELPDYSTGNVKEDLTLVEELLVKNGYIPHYVDLTRQDLKIPVVRAIVPGLDLHNGVSERRVLHFMKEVEAAYTLTIEAGGAKDMRAIADRPFEVRERGHTYRELLEQFYSLGIMGSVFRSEYLAQKISSALKITPQELKARANHILGAMMVGAPRAYFMDLAQEEFWKAYCVDVPESLSNGQTISAESVVFLMTVMLNPEPNDRVFEVGTGSGRQAALLSLLCREVHTVERIRSLYESARQRLTNLQRLATGKNIHVYLGDATEKFPEALTGQGFDKIMVTASPTYEQLCAIARNLREEGLMVAPLTIPGKQEMPLVLYQKKNNELVELFRLDGFMFVPLLTGTTEGDSAAKRPILGVDGITLDIIKSLEQAIAHLDTKRVPLKNRLLTASSVQVSLTERGLRISELGTRLILDRLTIGRERLLISVQPGVYHLISRTGSNTPHPTPLTDSLVDQKKAESTTAAFNAAA